VKAEFPTFRTTFSVRQNKRTFLLIFKVGENSQHDTSLVVYMGAWYSRVLFVLSHQMSIIKASCVPCIYLFLYTFGFMSYAV
jgi:hypothetical protein